jgi:hypothetical protein
MSVSEHVSLRGWVESEGGAVSITEACGALLDLGYRISVRELAELHDELDGPVVGRSRVITPGLADEIANELDDALDDAQADAAAEEDETDETHETDETTEDA